MRLAGGFILLAFALSQAVPARAAKRPKEPSGKEPFLVRSTATLTVDSVLAHFELFDRELKSLKARFTQSVSMSAGAMNSSVEGTIAYAKPERLRVEHIAPDRQTIVSDGKALWIHRPSQNQVIESSLADWRAADPALDNLMQFGSYAAMLRTYEVSLDTASPALTLRPKAKGADPFELRLRLAPDTLFPRESELSVGEARIKTRFEDVRFNPDLAEALFRFSPPPGTDVFRNFKPPRFKP